VFVGVVAALILKTAFDALRYFEVLA
jgi:hypothetical protein